MCGVQGSIPSTTEKLKGPLYIQAHVTTPQPCVAYIPTLSERLNAEFLPAGKITGMRD